MDKGLIAAIVALAGVVAFQGRFFYNQYKKLDKRTTECEKDRLDLWSQVAELKSTQCSNPKCPKHQPKD